MIKTLLTLIICLPTFTYGQVYKMRIYRTVLSEYENNDWKVKETNTVNFIGVVDFNNDKIKTYGEEKTDYDLVKLKSKDLKENGDMVSVFDAVDKNGKDCSITFYLFSKERQKKEDAPVASFGVRYGELLLVFYMKKDD